MSTEKPLMPAAWKPLAKDVMAQAIEAALVGGDLSKLDASQRIAYYNRVCDSLGLNPLTKPFAYITLNGKLQLYALKDCTEQLRNHHGVSIQISAREVTEDCYVVTARATLPDQRQDESIGAVPIGALKGEARANAMMKAETKAKRRVTLSICGLGMLDETEVGSVPNAQLTPDPPSGLKFSQVALDTVVNMETGEEIPAASRPPAPEGYRYIDGYVCDSGGWHRLTFLRGDASGGSFLYKTRLERVGEIARQAYQDGIPVRCEGRPNAKTKGEWILDKIHVWKPDGEVGSDDVIVHHVGTIEDDVLW